MPSPAFSSGSSTSAAASLRDPTPSLPKGSGYLLTTIGDGGAVSSSRSSGTVFRNESVHYGVQRPHPASTFASPKGCDEAASSGVLVTIAASSFPSSREGSRSPRSTSTRPSSRRPCSTQRAVRWWRGAGAPGRAGQRHVSCRRLTGLTGRRSRGRAGDLKFAEVQDAVAADRRLDADV
jgi:hypothetical protein